MTDELDKLKTAFDDAVVERARMRDARDKRRHELMQEAAKQVARQIAQEFPDWQTVQDTETTARQTLDDAKIAAGKEKLARMNYGRGTLIEWETKRDQWFGEKRYWHYRTGRRGVLMVWERGSEYPDNIHHGYALPNYGDLYIRLLKKDGTPGRQFYKFGNMAADQILPKNWLPEHEKHENAAPSEE